jgi:putative ubiquitin-RnfH superfamily antitoxin RatB of RatAB toxin-antitoxin module
MADHNHDLIEVEVAYALPRTQTVVILNVPAGTTVREAIARSGIAGQIAAGDWDMVAVGVCGKRVPLTTVLHEHDRVEIYRSLIADPKQARRKRARLRDVNQP